MIPDLRSSRGKSTTSEISFYPGNLEERLTGGTQRTTGLMVRYEVVKVSRLLSRKDLVRYCDERHCLLLYSTKSPLM